MTAWRDEMATEISTKTAFVTKTVFVVGVRSYDTREEAEAAILTDRIVKIIQPGQREGRNFSIHGCARLIRENWDALQSEMNNARATASVNTPDKE
jgi:hypothetical protein